MKVYCLTYIPTYNEIELITLEKCLIMLKVHI